MGHECAKGRPRMEHEFTNGRPRMGHEYTNGTNAADPSQVGARNCGPGGRLEPLPADARPQVHRERLEVAPLLLWVVVRVVHGQSLCLRRD